MEDALVPIVSFVLSVDYPVLILVVMEDALVLQKNLIVRVVNVVLILVVMEDALVHTNTTYIPESMV